jgi:hypothetical protein
MWRDGWSRSRSPDRTDRVKCLVEFARRGWVICLPDDVFIVPEPALKLLRPLKVPHHELSRWAG